MQIKICGISTAEALASVAASAADAVGFVFYPPSPRAVTMDQAAALGAQCPAHLQTVALLVDADDALIDDVMAQLRPDWLQLHGRETPERAAEISARHDVRLMKAIGVSGPEDLAKLAAYQGAVDQFLLDAKPPSDAALPGGNGTAFDWDLLHEAEITLPWLLAGGLDEHNVSAAIAASAAKGVDVSSGVEAAPGRKDPARIAAFATAARTALDAAAHSA